MENSDTRPVPADSPGPSDKQATTDALTEHVAPEAFMPGLTRRRGPQRWLRRTAVSLLVLAVLLAAGTVGAGWYFSSQLLVPDHSVEYDATISAVDGNQVTLTRTDETLKPMTLGLAWQGGYAVVDNTVRPAGESVVRTVTRVVRGSLQAGLAVYADRNIFVGDPKTARGLDYNEVSVPGDLGDLPAWYVPPTAKDSGGTWVIAAHGRGENRQETLRVLPSFAAAGLSTLAITYRNDVGAPASPDGLYHLGDTEWRDVQAAVRYAHEHGATAVVLYGLSFGGGTVMTALQRMPEADAALVRAVVLDSPAMDWATVIDLQAAQRSLPFFLTWTAKRLVEYRAAMSLASLNQRTYAATLHVPVLMFVDQADTRIPPTPAIEFASSRPDLVTLVLTTGAGHTGSWNLDSAGYESALLIFLRRFS